MLEGYTIFHLHFNPDDVYLKPLQKENTKRFI